MKITKKAKFLINWRSISIKNRLLALFSFCLILSSLVSIAFNAHLDLPFEMNIVVTAIAAIHAIAFYQAIKNRINDKGRAIYLFSLMTFLPIAWVFNGGFDGPIPMHYFTYLIISIFALSKRYRRYVTIYSLLLICAVLIIQNYFSHIIVPYDSQQVKLIDMEISFLQVIISIILLTIMYTNLNEGYQKNLLRQKRKLRQSFNELRIAKELAEKATIAKSNFITNISHEIRTPLNGIVGIADILDVSQLNDEQKTLIQSLKSSSHTLSDLVNDLLDLSKIEANKMVLNYEYFDIRKIAREVKELIRLQTKDKDILFKINIDPNLPQSIKIDRTKYKQVLINLLSNASKFTERGEISLEISYDSAKEILLTSVKDTGIGISKNNLLNIFAPFTQLSVPNGLTNNGVGMGLAISKKMIELMKGEIKA